MLMYHQAAQNCASRHDTNAEMLWVSEMVRSACDQPAEGLKLQPRARGTGGAPHPQASSEEGGAVGRPWGLSPGL